MLSAPVRYHSNYDSYIPKGIARIFLIADKKTYLQTLSPLWIIKEMTEVVTNLLITPRTLGRYSTILPLLLHDLVTVSVRSVLVTINTVLVQIRSQILWAPIHIVL